MFKKIFSLPTLTLVVALTLSCISAWYSVTGLTVIFSAAVIPIIIMGGTLEVAKVVVTVWLHKYWKKSNWQLKAYLIPALIGLSLLTNIGVYGFLSKSHSDQALTSGDVQSKVDIYDQKIATIKDNIGADKTALKQMDEQVNQLLGRTTDANGANRAVAVRKQQLAERNRINKEINDYQIQLDEINTESAPIRAQSRKVEAEVGPIKWIAALFYGDNPSPDLLERAVRYVIMLIVLIFDPLALSLVIAASKGYEWQKEESILDDKEEYVPSPGTKVDTVSFPIDLNPPIPATYHLFEEDVNEESETTASTNEDISESIDASAEEYDAHLNDSDSDESEENITEEITEIHEKNDTQDILIETEDVTHHDEGDGYVTYEGTKIHKNALLHRRPDLFAAIPDNQENTYGTAFPIFAKQREIFVRTDVIPHAVFEFNGNNWNIIDKSHNMEYLYNDDYVIQLISLLDQNKYDVNLLTENEKIRIEQFLSEK